MFPLKKLSRNQGNAFFRMANNALLESYWQIGRLIVKDEQDGNLKAKYGKGILKNLAERLTLEFGKGFDYTNLTNMRKFFLAFPILDVMRQELIFLNPKNLEPEILLT